MLSTFENQPKRFPTQICTENFQFKSCRGSSSQIYSRKMIPLASDTWRQFHLIQQKPPHFHDHELHSFMVPLVLSGEKSHLHYFFIRSRADTQNHQSAVSCLKCCFQAFTVVMSRTSDNQKHNPTFKDTLDDIWCNLTAQRVSGQPHAVWISPLALAWVSFHNYFLLLSFALQLMPSDLF